MTDEEYRERFIRQFADLIVASHLWSRDEAVREATQQCERCPREDMEPEFAADPEGTASQDFAEWNAEDDDYEDELMEEAWDDEDQYPELAP